MHVHLHLMHRCSHPLKRSPARTVASCSYFSSVHVFLVVCACAHATSCSYLTIASAPLCVHTCSCVSLYLCTCAPSESVPHSYTDACTCSCTAQGTRQQAAHMCTCCFFCVCVSCTHLHSTDACICSSAAQ